MLFIAGGVAGDACSKPGLCILKKRIHILTRADNARTGAALVYISRRVKVAGIYNLHREPFIPSRRNVERSLAVDTHAVASSCERIKPSAQSYAYIHALYMQSTQKIK